MFSVLISVRATYGIEAEDACVEDDANFSGHTMSEDKLLLMLHNRKEETSYATHISKGPY